MPNINVQLSGGSFQIIDNTGSIQRVNSPIPTILAQGTVSFYEPYFQVLVAGSVLTLPAATIFVAYVRNIGANNITVAWTPAGGVSATIGIVLPSSVLIYHSNYTTTPGSGGLTAITLTASTATTPAEVLLAQ